MRLRGLISLLNNLGPKGSHRKKIVPLFVPLLFNILDILNRVLNMRYLVVEND
jgi:hypothetical protein